MDRLEVFKQLTIFTYPLQTKEGEGWYDQTRDIQTIGLVHVHPREDGQMRGVQTIEKFTYELEMREDVHDVNT